MSTTLVNNARQAPPVTTDPQSKQHADGTTEFTLPQVDSSPANLSLWLTVDSCRFRRNKLLGMILYELALERADYMRIRERHDAQQLKIDSAREIVGFKTREQAEDAAEASIINQIEDAELANMADEADMDAGLMFMKSLQEAAEAMREALPALVPKEE